jgi:mono/diheme cytochrome c family protein
MSGLIRSRRRAGIAAALALGLGSVALTGCGGESTTPDIAAGKVTFSNLCASCHTLADSGKPPANIGPNLDDAFRAARQVGMPDDQFSGLVKRWIAIAQPPMPRKLATGQDLENVAAYVASVAGTNAESPPRAAPPPTPQVPANDRQTLDPAGP